jgi:hypothetical protein
MKTIAERLALSPSELNDLHRQEMREFLLTHSGAFTKSEAYWKLTNFHAEVYQAISDASTRQLDQARRARDAAEALKNSSKPVDGSAPSPVPQPSLKISKSTKTENLCRDCGSVIPPSGKRGRPASHCVACKAINLVKNESQKS